MTFFSRMILPVMALACMLLFTGCIEETHVIKLNKDGSGTIQVRRSMSPKLVEMMQQGGEEGAAPEPLYSEEEARAEAAGFGEGVTFESGKEVTREDGWKGSLVTYKFDDINKVILNFEPAEGEDEQDGGAAAELMEDVRSYTFAYTPGDVNSLTIKTAVMTPEELAKKKEGEEKPEEQSDEEIAQSMPMMKSMLAGMRISYYIVVDGEVSESDAMFRSEKKPNMFSLVDIDMDSIMKSDDALKGMLKLKDVKAYRAKKYAGVEVQDADATIKFK